MSTRSQVKLAAQAAAAAATNKSKAGANKGKRTAPAAQPSAGGAGIGALNEIDPPAPASKKNKGVLCILFLVYPPPPLIAPNAVPVHPTGAILRHQITFERCTRAPHRRDPPSSNPERSSVIKSRSSAAPVHLTGEILRHQIRSDPPSSNHVRALHPCTSPERSSPRGNARALNCMRAAGCCGKTLIFLDRRPPRRRAPPWFFTNRSINKQ